MTPEKVCYIFSANNDLLTLPIKVKCGSDVFKTLFCHWDQYLDMLNRTPELEACVCYAEKTAVLLKMAINAFFEADYESANQSIQEAIEILCKNEHGSHLIADLETLYIDAEAKQWFRARKAGPQPLEIADMKHIPANRRCVIANQRYSINGIPCLYLGNSIYGCWEELGRPQLNELWVNRFRPIKPIKLLNLSTTGYEIIHADHNLKYVDQSEASFNNAVIEYFSNWILQSACSVVVEEDNRTFKEEYIVPQLVMGNIKHFYIDGVMYFSNRVMNGFTRPVSWIAKNIAIPAFDVKGYGDNKEMYSPYIDSLFKMSYPLHVGMFADGVFPPGPATFHESSNWARTHSGVFITSLACEYCRTEFYRCEIELQNYFLQDTQ